MTCCRSGRIPAVRLGNGCAVGRPRVCCTLAVLAGQHGSGAVCRFRAGDHQPTSVNASQPTRCLCGRRRTADSEAVWTPRCTCVFEGCVKVACFCFSRALSHFRVPFPDTRRSDAINQQRGHFRDALSKLSDPMTPEEVDQATTEADYASNRVRSLLAQPVRKAQPPPGVGAGGGRGRGGGKELSRSAGLDTFDKLYGAPLPPSAASPTSPCVLPSACVFPSV